MTRADTVQLHLRLPQRTHRRLKQHAAMHYMALNAAAIDCLQTALDYEDALARGRKRTIWYDSLTPEQKRAHHEKITAEAQAYLNEVLADPVTDLTQKQPHP